MTWAQDQRIAFIKERLDAGLTVRRADLQDKFYISTATCATTFREFERRHPNVMRYDASLKAYVPQGYVPPVVDWQARAEAAEAQAAVYRSFLDDALSYLDDAMKDTYWSDAEGFVETTRQALQSTSTGEDA